MVQTPDIAIRLRLELIGIVIQCMAKAKLSERSSHLHVLNLLAMRECESRSCAYEHHPNHQD